MILGGSPFTASDPGEEKGPVQRRVEEEIGVLLRRIVEADFPFLGACYGVGLLGGQMGAVERLVDMAGRHGAIRVAVDGRMLPVEWIRRDGTLMWLHQQFLVTERDPAGGRIAGLVRLVAI